MKVKLKNGDVRTIRSWMLNNYVTPPANESISVNDLTRESLLEVCEDFTRRMMERYDERMADDTIKEPE